MTTTIATTAGPRRALTPSRKTGPAWLRDRLAVELRLSVARDEARAADAKAGELLKLAAGVLLPGGAAGAAWLRPGGAALMLAVAPGVALLAGLAALLAVVYPRGGCPAVWLVPDRLDPAAELVTVARIVTRKHRHLRTATAAVSLAVMLGVAAACLAGVTQ